MKQTMIELIDFHNWRGFSECVDMKCVYVRFCLQFCSVKGVLTYLDLPTGT